MRQFNKKSRKRKRWERRPFDIDIGDGCSDDLPRQPSYQAGGSSHGERVHATPYKPCPVCGRTSRCSAPRDSNGVWLCIGGLEDTTPGWTYLGPAKKDPAWGVYRPAVDPWTAGGPCPFNVGPRPESKPPEPPQEPPGDNPWPARAAEYEDALTPERREELSEALGLPVLSTFALGIGWHEELSCWTFPECDGTGEVIGLTTRDADGTKRCLPGSRRGLTLPTMSLARAVAQRRVFIVEGPSDTLALWAAGLAVVGRPSNCGGAAHLAKLLADLPADVNVLVLGENDAKADGTWPGRDGAVSVCRSLRRDLPDRAISWVLPPASAKDARASFVDLHLGDDLQAWGRAWDWFVTNLVPGDDTNHQDKTQDDYQNGNQDDQPPDADAMEEARRSQADLEGLVDRLRAQKLPRAPRCGHVRVTLVALGQGGPVGTRGVSGHFRCRRLSCPHCLRHKIIRDLLHAGNVTLANFPEDSLRTGPLYVRETEWSRWPAVRKALKRAGVLGHVRVRVRGDLVLVLADKVFPGAVEVSPPAALSLLREAIADRLDPERHCIRWHGTWGRPKKEHVFRALSKVLHPRIVEAVAVEMGATVGDVPKINGIGWEFPEDVQPDVPQSFLEVLVRLSTFLSWGPQDQETKVDTGPTEAELNLAREWARAAMRGEDGPPGCRAADARMAEAGLRLWVPEEEVVLS
jgi:hypothetical protein